MLWQKNRTEHTQFFISLMSIAAAVAALMFLAIFKITYFAYIRVLKRRQVNIVQDQILLVCRCLLCVTIQPEYLFALCKAFSKLARQKSNSFIENSFDFPVFILCFSRYCAALPRCYWNAVLNFILRS